MASRRLRRWATSSALTPAVSASSHSRRRPHSGQLVLAFSVGCRGHWGRGVFALASTDVTPLLKSTNRRGSGRVGSGHCDSRRDTTSLRSASSGLLSQSVSRRDISESSPVAESLGTYPRPFLPLRKFACLIASALRLASFSALVFCHFSQFPNKISREFRQDSGEDSTQSPACSCSARMSRGVPSKDLAVSRGTRPSVSSLADHAPQRTHSPIASLRSDRSRDITGRLSANASSTQNHGI